MASDWPTATVAELQRDSILRVEDGNHGEYRPRPDEFVDSGVAFIRAADMDSGRVLFDSAAKINERARQRITKGIGAPGDVLLSHKGTVGKVAVVPEDSPAFVCSPQTTFWRTLDEGQLDRKYLHAFLRSRVFNQQLASRAAETDMAPYVSLTSQRGLSVILPPVELQRTIGEILGNLDDKIELNRRMNETLEAIARVIFKSWFVDFNPVHAKVEGRQPVGISAELADLFPSSLEPSVVGDVPSGWSVLPLPQLIDLNPKRDLSQGDEAPYLEMSNVPAGSARAGGWARREFKSGTRFINGDVLLARITPSLEHGKTVYVDFLQEGEVGWGSTEFIVMRSRPPLPTEYSYFVARSDELRDHAITNMTGSSGRQRVPTSCFDSLSMPVPPSPIAGRFGVLVRPLMQRMKDNDNESSTLAAIRDGLLPKLISGEIRVKDAEKVAGAAMN
jgi:type I restriction enzyme S subunit